MPSKIFDELITPIAEGNTETVINLIASDECTKKTFSEKDEDNGFTLLDFAIEFHKLEVAKILLNSEKCPKDSKVLKEYLFNAVQKNNGNLIKILLDESESDILKQKNLNGETPLMIALNEDAEDLSPETIQTLFNSEKCTAEILALKGGDGLTAAEIAAEKLEESEDFDEDDKEALEKILNKIIKGKKPAPKKKVEEKKKIAKQPAVAPKVVHKKPPPKPEKKEKTPLEALFQFMEKGKLDDMKNLIDKSTTNLLLQTDPNGNTPLMHATNQPAHPYYREMLQIILNSKKCTRKVLAIKNKQGETIHELAKKSRRGKDRFLLNFKTKKLLDDVIENTRFSSWFAKMENKDLVIKIDKEKWDFAKQAVSERIKLGRKPPYKLDRKVLNKIIQKDKNYMGKYNNNADAAKFHHSFLVIPDESAPEGFRIGAMARGKTFTVKDEKGQEKDVTEGILGHGNFGLAKIVQWEDGMVDMVKIEANDPYAENKAEQAILKKIGDLIKVFNRGRAERTPWLAGRIHGKKYSIGKLKGKQGMDDFLDEMWDRGDQSETTKMQRLKIALQTAKAFKALHEFNIVHGDIKPANIRMDTSNNPVIISPIDFGFSIDLKGKDSITLRYKSGAAMVKGTPGYIAPEIMTLGTYSFKSDIFAIGTIFSDKNDLNLSKELPDLIKKMKAIDPKKRPSLEVIIKTLDQHIKKQQTLEAKQAIHAKPPETKTMLPSFNQKKSKAEKKSGKKLEKKSDKKLK